ncbi:leucyl-cystinyl aminopeptidase [Rhynchocyon petersi]
MIENSMFEEEPDVVDLAKEPCLHPLEPDEVEYEPRGSRLLVRGLGEHELDEDEEDYESSAKLLGMSFMNRSSGLRNSPTGYRQSTGTCSMPSARSMVVCGFVIMVAISVIMVIYLLPKCTFTKEGCHKEAQSMKVIQPNATNGKVCPWTQYRLPTAVKPLHYKLHLHPNLTSMTFKGSVIISLQALQATGNIILHSSGLNILNVSFMSAVSSQEKHVEVLECKSQQQIAITPSEALIEGHNYTLKIEYSANLTNFYYQFYGFDYKDENNRKKYFAATQFEPLSARTAFPCFDEPSLKATYSITITRAKEYTALSNMPKKSSVLNQDGLLEDEFYESVNMSTYLVAFAVGEMRNLSRDVNGILVSIYAVPDKIEQAHPALERAVTLLDFYQKYFEIGYSISKIDLLAVPAPGAGAMENWGLITLSEKTLLCDSVTSSVTERRLVTKIIAHELAHQWFGNLVTMNWWDGLWMTEGFVTFMEYYVSNKLFGELSTYEDFLDSQFRIMKRDSLSASRPLSIPITAQGEIGEAFDPMSYIKGACIYFMLQTHVGDDVFRRATTLCLNKHSYRSIESDDLWDCFNEVTNKTDVKKMMKTWTMKEGYPLVTVQRKGNELIVEQEKFFLNKKPEIQLSNESYLWHIPLSFIAGGKNLSQYQSVSLLDKKSDVISLTEGVQWFKVNVDMTGYYMVHYADKDYEALIEQLKTNPYVLSDKDRANLINNVFELSSIGKVSAQQAFDLLAYLGNETYSAPIIETIQQISHILNILDVQGHMDLCSKLVARVFNLLQNQIQQQTWTDDGTLSMRNLRSKLLKFACTYNLGNCRTVALKLFNDWMASNGTQRLPLDVKDTVFQVGANTEKGWSYLLSLYSSLHSEDEKTLVLAALASTEDARKVYWLMKTTLDGKVIQTHKLATVILVAGQRLPGNLLVWDFLKENWKKLAQKFGVKSYTLRYIVAGSTGLFSTKRHFYEVEAFFENQSEEVYSLRYIQEALDGIQRNIKLRENILETLPL